MIKAFVFLVLANIAVALYFHISSSDRLQTGITLFHPEKIVVLPAKAPCLKWGELLGPGLQQARSEISKLEIEHSHFIEIPKGEVIAYWVYIPSFKTDQETAKQIEALKKLEIPYLHIQENSGNPWHDTISLAMLHEKNEAINLVNELNSKGIDRVAISEQSLERFELIIRNPGKQIFAQLQERARHLPEAKLEVTECDRL